MVHRYVHIPMVYCRIEYLFHAFVGCNFKVVVRAMVVGILFIAARAAAFAVTLNITHNQSGKNGIIEYFFQIEI